MFFSIALWQPSPLSQLNRPLQKLQKNILASLRSGPLWCHFCLALTQECPLHLSRVPAEPILPSSDKAVTASLELLLCFSIKHQLSVTKSDETQPHIRPTVIYNETWQLLRFPFLSSEHKHFLLPGGTWIMWSGVSQLFSAKLTKMLCSVPWTIKLSWYWAHFCLEILLPDCSRNQTKFSLTGKRFLQISRFSRPSGKINISCSACWNFTKNSNNRRQCMLLTTTKRPGGGLSPIRLRGFWNWTVLGGGGVGGWRNSNEDHRTRAEQKLNGNSRAVENALFAPLVCYRTCQLGPMWTNRQFGGYLNLTLCGIFSKHPSASGCASVCLSQSELISSTSPHQWYLSSLILLTLVFDAFRPSDFSFQSETSGNQRLEVFLKISDSDSGKDWGRRWIDVWETRHIGNKREKSAQRTWQDNVNISLVWFASVCKQNLPLNFMLREMVIITP